MATWTKLTAGNTDSNTYGVTSVQSFDEAGPPTGEDGIPLRGVGSVLVELVAPGVETFDGTGAVRGWYLPDNKFDSAAVWAPFHRADDTLEDGAGLSIIRLTLPIHHPTGRLVMLADDIGHSGAGTTFTLRLYTAPRARGV